MASDPFYPFGLPGINHLGSTGHANPLTASLDMIRNAMSSFGQSASLASGTMAQSLNPEDLEKRISELKVVENWLKLNLSMLSSSIQGMEVQLATIKTLRSFVEMGSQGGSEDGQQPSPLEIVLGIRKPPTHASGNPGRTHVQPEPPPPAPAPKSSESPVERPRAYQQSTPETDNASTSAASVPADDAAGPSAMPETSQAAAQAWWDMLQNQFNQIAAATTQAAQFAKPADATAEEKPSAKPRAARKSSTRSAAKSAGAGSSAASRPSARKATRSVKTPKN